MVRKRPSLASFFTRSSTRTPSDASTLSVSSRSRSPSPSFLIDDDPFAKLDSPKSNAFDLPSLSPEFIHVNQHSSLLSQCHSLQKHDRSVGPPPSRPKPPKCIRNTPSLPSLSKLACPGGSSYASVVAAKGANAASKRFPVEPWDLVAPLDTASAPHEDDYGQIQATSRFATLKGPKAKARPLAPMLPNHTSESLEPAESRKRQSSPVPARLAPERHARPTSLCWIHPNHESCKSYRVAEPDSSLARELAKDFPWAVGRDEQDAWEVVHDFKDALESEIDSEDEDGEPVYIPSRNRHEPTICQAAWQPGQGYRGTTQTGASDENDTPSDYGSDGYRSDAREAGGSGSGSGRGRQDDDDDDDDDDGRVRSTFSDDEDSNSDGESVNDSSEDSEDDVPLAKRIPGALQAQKSIRIKDRAEKERKRKERHAQKQRSRVAKVGGAVFICLVYSLSLTVICRPSPRRVRVRSRRTI